MDLRWCMIVPLAVCMCALPVAISESGLSVPMAPDNFTATTIGPRNISFTWDNDSIDHMYRLSCGTADTPTVLTRNVTGASSVEYHVFHPNTLYTCNLSVISNGTVGPNTTVEVQTAEDIPSAPAWARVGVVSSSKINVTWGSPEHENGNITHYAVYINGEVSHNVTGSTHATTVSGLPAPCDVNVSVSAITGAGKGPARIANSTQEEAPGPVSHLLVTPLSPSSLAVHWGRPQNPNGYIHQYYYTVRDRDREVMVGTVDSSGNSENLIIQVDMLVPHVEYTVGVSARTCGGGGPPQNETVYTVEAVPAAPQIASPSVVRNFTSIQLNWTTTNGGGRIAGHILTYEALYATECQRMTEDTPLSTPILAGVIRTVSKTVHGLDPNVSYSVSVTAYNSAGIRGDTSTPQVVSPLVIPGRRGYAISSRTSTIQLRLSGVGDCAEWRMLEHSGTVLSAVVSRLYLLCQQCEHPGIQLTDPTLLCTGDRNQVVFRATLARCPCRKCHTCFEFWLSIPSPVLKLENQILLADTTCPLYTDSLDSNSCMLQETAGQDCCTGSIVGVLFGGIFTGVLISILTYVTVTCFRKCKATQQEKEDSEPAPTVRYLPDPKPVVQQEVDGYEPLYLFQSTGNETEVLASSKAKSKRGKVTAAASLPTKHCSTWQDSSTQEPADGEYEIPSLVVPPSVQSSNAAVVQNSTSPGLVEYDTPETPVTEAQVSKQSPPQLASAAAHEKGRGLPVSQKHFDCQTASAARRVHRSESDRSAGMKLTPATSACTSVQESPLTSQEQKQLHKKKPLLPNKVMMAQARAQGAGPPRAEARRPTVRPKPQDKVSRNIPTAPNSAYRAITRDTENLYT